MICQSGAVSPSPVPLTGSLLATDVILQTGAAVQLSEVVAETVTGTILWFGGHRVLGLAVTLVMVGGVVSTTVTVAEQEADAPLLSVAVRVTPVLPKP